MKPVAVNFHQSGGNRHFWKAHLGDADRGFCHPGLNLAVFPENRVSYNWENWKVD